MNAIESALQAGPKKYPELRGLLPVYQLDVVLKRMLQERLIRVTMRGFELPVTSPNEETEPQPFGAGMRACNQCGEVKEIERFTLEPSGHRRRVCNTCRYVHREARIAADGGGISQLCRKCNRTRRPNQFPALVRGYSHSVCYSCRKRK